MHLDPPIPNGSQSRTLMHQIKLTAPSNNHIDTSPGPTSLEAETPQFTISAPTRDPGSISSPWEFVP